MGPVTDEVLPPTDGFQVVHRSLEGATDMEDADSAAANCDLHSTTRCRRIKTHPKVL